MFQLRKFLEGMGCDVVLDNELKQAERMGEDTPLAEWEEGMVKNTIWYLSEGGNGTGNKRRDVQS